MSTTPPRIAIKRITMRLCWPILFCHTIFLLFLMYRCFWSVDWRINAIFFKHSRTEPKCNDCGENCLIGLIPDNRYGMHQIVSLMNGIQECNSFYCQPQTKESIGDDGSHRSFETVNNW